MLRRSDPRLQWETPQKRRFPGVKTDVFRPGARLRDAQPERPAMSLSITIAAAVTIAVTARLMYLFFLSGRTLTNATFFGRLVSRTEAARRAFVRGWREQSWRYRLIAYPSMLLSMGLVSLLLNWLMLGLDITPTFSDKLRYCLLVFGVGVTASLLLSLLIILGVFFVIALIGAWWRPEKADKEETRTEA